MARTGMETSAKFRLLVRRVKLPEPFVRGLLETLWDVVHASGNPVIGTPDAVEAASKWPHDEGAWFEALRAGQWIDEVADGKWAVHDYWDHAPAYVVSREAKRNSMTRSEFIGKVLKSSENGNFPPAESSPSKARPEKRRKNPPYPPSGGTKESPTEEFAIPEGLDCESFRRAWSEWVQHRREIRKPVKPTTAAKQLKTLAGLGPDRAVEVIDFTIAKGWQGLAFDCAAGNGRAAPAAKQKCVPFSDAEMAHLIYNPHDPTPQYQACADPACTFGPCVEARSGGHP